MGRRPQRWARPVPFKALTDEEIAKRRGPQPPYAVCPECGTRSIEPWDNPVLKVYAKRQPIPDTRGGVIICRNCLPPRCSKCDGTGWHEVEPRRFARCTCRSGKDAPPRAQANVPSDLAHATRENIDRAGDRESILTAIGACVRTPARDLFLYGSTGTGKTFIAIAVARNLAAGGKRFAFATSINIIEDMRRAAPEYLQRWVQPEVLVLDDVGTEKASEHSLRTLTNLYEQRRASSGRTLITSNYDMDGLSDRWREHSVAADRLLSRFMGFSDVVLLTGDDRRRT